MSELNPPDPAGRPDYQGGAPATSTPPPGKSSGLSTDGKLSFMQPPAPGDLSGNYPQIKVDLTKVSLEALEHELSNRFAAWALVGVTVHVTQPGNVVQMKDRYSSRTALPVSALVGVMECHLTEIKTLAAAKMAESRTQQAPAL